MNLGLLAVAVRPTFCASLGNWVDTYITRDERLTTDDTLTELVVHLYVSSTYTLKTTDSEITVTQESDYPWSGDIKFTVKGSPLGLSLKLRIPAWAKSWKVR